MNIGERVKNLRINKNLSQKTLAEILNVSDRTILAWEKEENELKASSIILLAKFFNVTTDYILGFEDEYGNKIKS